MIQSVISFFEKNSFGVCTYLAQKFRLSLSRVRLFFIYSSFLSVGAPIIFYFFAFIALDIRKYVKQRKRTSIFEL
jgi:phage shock protein C